MPQTTRLFSVFTLAAWAGFHAVSAAEPLSASGVDMLSLAHGALAVWFACIVARASHSAPGLRLDCHALSALAAGLVLAAASASGGEAAHAPGAFALAVLVTLLALGLDRMSGSGEEGVGDAEHRRYMRLAASLGATMGSPRDGREDRR